MSCVSKMDILYSCIHSDHHPVLFCLDCDIVPECNTSSDAGNTTKLKVHWNNLRPDQVHEYTFFFFFLRVYFRQKSIYIHKI